MYLVVSQYDVIKQAYFKKQFHFIYKSFNMK